MKWLKKMTIGCLIAGVFAWMAGCSGGVTEPEATPTMTPDVTESAAPSPTNSAVPQQTAGAAASATSTPEAENKMTVLFVGRADATTVEIMAEEQVKTAQLDARMQERLSAMDLRDNQSIVITYEMREGQMVITDIEK